MDLRADLARTEAYGDLAPGSVELVETHISWVLLAGEFAYKVKRPVHLAFVDQSTLARREFLCGEELRLNRRFAPELYLGVVPITIENGEARMGGAGEPVDYAVRMRRFEPDQQLDRLLEHGGIAPAELAAFGRRLAQLHARLPIATVADPWGGAQALRELMLRNLNEACDAARVTGCEVAIEALRPGLLAKLEALSPRLERRRAEQRVRECHGDLHTRNIARVAGALVAFDCLEFEPAFRWIDVADEAALLLVDLERRGCGRHAQAFWNAYLECSGDYDSLRVLDLYKAHRALVRAKVAALSLHESLPAVTQSGLQVEHRELIAAAERALSVRPVWLVLVSGLSGSGKTWLAQRLAPELGLVHIRSDLERKRLAGLDPLAHSGSGLGSDLYAAATTGAVYEHLARSAEAVLDGDYGVIVDATFLRREQRRRFAELAARPGVRSALLHCQAEPQVLRRRLIERQRLGSDPSEADVRVLEWQLRECEPIDPAECGTLMEVDTQRGDAVDRTLARLRSLR